MATTIVEYSDTRTPENSYPARIVSPTRSGHCCFSALEALGEVQQEGQWLYQYKRCRSCGYAVRLIIRQVPDEALIAELRKTLAVTFSRNNPDY